MTKFNDCRAFVICSSLITRFTILRLFVEVVRRAANNVSILVLTPSRQDVMLKPTLFRILNDRVLDAAIKFKRVDTAPTMRWQSVGWKSHQNCS